MRILRRIAIGIVTLIVLASVGADVFSSNDYATQFRDRVSEPPSRAFLLGTDELGRDRFSRLLYATRISILIAPATAFASTAIATALGMAAGWRGGRTDAAITILTDLFLSLPWLFLLLTLRALLPLDIPAAASLSATALLLAIVGWPSGARVIRASVAALRNSPLVVQAQAYGSGTGRLLWMHVLPNLWPAVAAQFWILVPAFLLTEANLGLLGLGVSEPVPSLGNMMVELRDYYRIPEAPWIFAPAALLVTLVASLHFIVSGVDTCE